MPRDFLQQGFLIGDIVRFNDRSRPGYFRVVDRDKVLLPYSISTALTPLGSTGFTSMDDLNPPCDQFFQIGIQVITNCKVYVRQPSGNARFGTNKNATSSFLSDVTSPINGDEEINMFIVENKQPQINITNHTSMNQTSSMTFYGWKYRIESVPEPTNGNFTTVQIGGFE